MKLVVLVLVSVVLFSTVNSAVKREVHSGGCPKNAVFKECTNICPDKSCANFLTVSTCFSLRCGPPACACKEGHVFLSAEDKTQGCVPRETCSKLAKIRAAQPVTST